MIALNPNAGVADPHIACDLRRTPTRQFAEMVCERAEPLEREERELLRAVYRDGLSATRVAEIRNDHPRRVAKRVRRCVQRMLTPEFEFVFQRYRDWPPTRRRIAQVCILQGKSLRATARQLRVSLHVVIRHVHAIRAAAAEGGEA